MACCVFVKINSELFDLSCVSIMFASCTVFASCKRTVTSPAFFLAPPSALAVVMLTTEIDAADFDVITDLLFVPLFFLPPPPYVAA